VIAHFHTFAALVLLAQSAQVPQNDGWVTDLAHLLSSDQEQELEDLCDSYRVGTTRDIALLTVPDLGGRPIEDFALEVGRTWKIGTESLDEGALLVVSKADKKIRIEVGRGLEGELTDLVSGRIIRNVITPRFKEGDFYGGLRAGLEAIHAVLGGNYAPVEEPNEHAENGAGFLVLFIVFLVVVSIARRRRRGIGGGIPWWLLPMVLGSQGSGRRSSGWGNIGGGGIGGIGGGRSLGGGGGFRGFGGGGGFRGGGATGGW
jgi:uncharacterized protein